MWIKDLVPFAPPLEIYYYKFCEIFSCTFKTFFYKKILGDFQNRKNIFTYIQLLEN